MSDNREQEELHKDVERVVEIACKHLGPNDQALLRWATGIKINEPDPRQMACWDDDHICIGEPPF